MPVRGWLRIVALALPAVGSAATVEQPIFVDEHLPVVGDRLYPKRHRTELSVQLGAVPFEALARVPTLTLSASRHLSERTALTLLVGGGWGLPTGVHRQLVSATYGDAPPTYTYLASLSWSIDYSPIYGKLNWNGGRVTHFDLFVAKRFGATLERALDPVDGFAIGPTATPAIGGHVWLGPRAAVRFDVRDELLVAVRLAGPSVAFSQNASLNVGLSTFTKRASR